MMHEAIAREESSILKANFFSKRYFFVLLLVINHLYCNDGGLDPSFGTGGLVTTTISGAASAQAVIIQTDSKLVAVGSSGADVFTLVRYLTNGTIDTTFGTNGIVTTQFVAGTSSDLANAALLQTDNKIVAAGSSLTTHKSFALARYNTNGLLDTTFGTNGKVTTNFTGTSTDQANAVLQQSDNKLIALGSSAATTIPAFALARYLTNGTLDTTFGTNGKVTTNFVGGTSVDQIFGGALQVDSKIVAVGGSAVSTISSFALARYLTNGTIDTTFGTNGKVTTNFTVTSTDEALGVVIQGDGKIVAAGISTDTISGNSVFALARYNTNGTLDTTFGTNGKVTTNFGSSIDTEAFAVLLQTNNKIIVLGYSTQGGNKEFALARYNTNGSLDTTFGSGGLVLTSFGTGTLSMIQAALLQPNGSIVAAGNMSTNGGETSSFALARYFGTSGCIGTTPIGSDSVLTLFTTQQFVASGGRFAALALLNGGLGLCGNATFDSCFPVTGPLCLECFTLSLAQDLILNNVSSFGSLGNISGNGYSLSLSKNIGTITAGTCASTLIDPQPPCPDVKWGNLILVLNNDVILQDVLITFTGNSIINGQGNSLTLADGSALIIDAGANLLLKNLTIYGVDTNNIRCVDTLSTVSLANVAWVLDSNYSFTIGSLDVLEEFSISGPSNSFNYQSGQGSTIWSEGVMKIEYGVTFNYSPSTASKNLLSLSASTSELELNGGTLKASAVGMNLLRGLLTIKGTSTLQSLGANQSQGISLGDGLSSSNNLTVHITPAAQLVIQGPVVSNDA